MSDKKITHLLIDTSSLYKFGVGFDHPDFMKLLHYSRDEGIVKIFIPHIVWEERRTQLLDEAYSSMRKLKDAFTQINKQWESNIVLKGLGCPMLTMCNE